MRSRFSERFGFKKPRDAFQINDIDEALRNRLWNQFRDFYIVSIKTENDIIGNAKIVNAKDYEFFNKIYDAFLKLPYSPSTMIEEIFKNLNSIFFNFEWYEVYDFIEYVSSIYWNEKINQGFKHKVNEVLEEEKSGYRFVGEYIAPIIDEVEIKEIEEVFESEYVGAKRHLSNALELLSDRENPDYQNSIKESITAVEAVAQKITGRKSDLGSCLKVMELDLNNSFKNGLSQLYGWTNKEDGIRHAHTGEELRTSFDEAKFMLVSCSAIINYLISKSKNVN